MESGWRSADVVNGDSKFFITNKYIEHLAKDMRLWKHDDRYKHIERKPCGEHSFPPCLVHFGSNEPVSGLYTKGFARLIVDKMKTFIRNGRPFILRGGAQGGFLKTWTMPKRTITDYDKSVVMNF